MKSKLIALAATPLVGLLLSGGIFVVFAPRAHAIEQFYTELAARYVKPKSEEPNDVALATAFEQAGCTICHPGDDKHRLTRYGGHVAWRINKFDKASKTKMRKAFDEVGALPSDPHDPRSPTYGELFRQGELPPNSGHY